MFKKYLNNRLFILYIVPIVIGLLTVFSFQPFNFIIVNFLVLPIFFYVTVYINKKSKTTFRKKAYRKNLFIFGSLFGFSFYLSGISWITNSLTFDESFKILIPFALILIPFFFKFVCRFSNTIYRSFFKLQFFINLNFFSRLGSFRFYKSKAIYRFSLEFMGIQSFIFSRNYTNFKFGRIICLQFNSDNNIYFTSNFIF